MGKKTEEVYELRNTKTVKPSRIKGRIGSEAKSLEETIEAMIHSNEKPDMAESPIFTERSEGVRPETNIRTDRMEMAIEATDMITKTALAAREQRHNPIMNIVEKKEEQEPEA